MEQIDAQVTDLRYLSQAQAVGMQPVNDDSSGPGTAYDAHGTPPPNMSPGSASIGDNSAHHQGGSLQGSAAATPLGGSASSKRKAEEDAAAKQTRSKRNRYISIACNECKRRKIKCNGETPCQRCGNLNLNCLYAPNCCSNSFKDSDEYRHIASQINRLQDEVGYLNQAMRAVQTDSSRMGHPHDRAIATTNSSTVTPSPSQTSVSLQRPPDQPNGRRPGFRGPTSMAFSLDVANNTIANMGYKPVLDGNDEPNPHSQPEEHIISAPDGPLDPLLEYDQEEMVRLIRIHEAEVGIMYPVLDTKSIISHAKSLSSFLQGMKDQRSLHAINDEKTLQLKIVLCNALVVEENGHSHRATRLYESMENVLNRKLMADESDVANLPLLALLGGYRFLSNDEVLGWRVIGQVARLCMELGIHQRMGLMKIENEQERKNALNTFWTAYILDRRWAFGTGLPYVVQDEEVDPNLPLPEEYPYMVAMITYSRIGAKVWRQVSHFEPVLARELRQEEIERLDDEILEWYETVPDEVKVRNWDKERHMASTPSYNLQRLRIWTYLRFNQIRTWLYTPILHSATSIMSHPLQAQRVVDLAKDTIRYLNHLNNTTTLYHTMQVFYHQFLTSAISVVFLASVHAPVRFSAVCREEFYLALELVKDLSARSMISKRLWRTIKTLKDVAPRFGLNPDDDPHSTAALGMIGLARSHLEQDPDSRSQFQRPPMPPNPNSNEPMLDQNGSRIQSEMSRIFEGYVSLNGFQPGHGDDQRGPRQAPPPPQNSVGTGVYGADGTVYPHLREMF